MCRSGIFLCVIGNRQRKMPKASEIKSISGGAKLKVIASSSPRSSSTCTGGNATYKPNASISALANSGGAMRMTLESVRAWPIRLTLPYQPMRWSMTAQCILQEGRWMMLNPMACNSGSRWQVSAIIIVIATPRSEAAAKSSMIRGVRFQLRRVVEINILCRAFDKSSCNGRS